MHNLNNCRVGKFRDILLAILNEAPWPIVIMYNHWSQEKLDREYVRHDIRNLPADGLAPPCIRSCGVGGWGGGGGGGVWECVCVCVCVWGGGGGGGGGGRLFKNEYQLSKKELVKISLNLVLRPYVLMYG